MLSNFHSVVCDMARSCLTLALVYGLSVAQYSSADAAPLKLDFLPPDFPATDICRAPVEVLEADETQVFSGDEEDANDDEIRDWVSYLKRDIRRFKRLGADTHFEFIEELIALRTELDSSFGKADEAFARVDLYIDAGRIQEVEEKGLIEAVASMAEELSQSERVRLARYFMTGVGVAQDRARGEAMLANEAFKGNASALLELLRLQLAGAELVEWYETPERTATLAFGGKLGQLNRGLCGRAEFIAQAYLSGDLLEPNAELAFAWRKFAADQGGQKAAWRVVEHMLNADSGLFRDDEILHYLALALDENYRLDGSDVQALRDAGAQKAEHIASILARVHSGIYDRNRRSAVPHFELDIAIDSEGLNESGSYLSYLQLVTKIENAPGEVWTDLADELALRKGRWLGSEEIRSALENAVAAGDPEAYVKLASTLLSETHATGDASRSEMLLTDAVQLYGYTEAQRGLDAFYRCTSPQAPFQTQANSWSATNKATFGFPIAIDGEDFARISSASEPELLAHIQRLAMAGNSTALAGFLVGLENEVTVSDETLRHWARRVAASDKALELYAVTKYKLATNPDSSTAAVDFARRASLAIGPAMAIDLAVVLVDHHGRDKVIAEEVRELLEEAAERGEGASIRLLHRLSGETSDRIYKQYADVIETRGDFLALMFAAPFVDDKTFDDYMARAISIMRCTTKDITELVDAFANRDRTEEVMHWLRVGSAIEHGHSMSRLRLDTYRLDQFDKPLNTSASVEELSSFDALRRDYAAVSSPGEMGFNRHKAVALLSRAILSDEPEKTKWAFEEFATAEPGIRRSMLKLSEVTEILKQSAEAGHLEAQYALGVHLRDTAQGADSLASSTDWLRRAAESGHKGAMVDFGYALAHGVGTPSDRKHAIIWLRRADTLLEPRAAALLGLVEALMDQG